MRTGLVLRVSAGKLACFWHFCPFESVEFRESLMKFHPEFMSERNPPKTGRMNEFTHFDETGASHMVDVSEKPATMRTARAMAMLLMQPDTLRSIRQVDLRKGNVLEVARLAGIMATKRTDELIPLCHSLGLDSASIEFEFVSETELKLESKVVTTGRTGVEMEALTAVTIAGLTVYDMCKAVDRAIEMTSVRLLEKTGGRSGHFIRDQQRSGDM